MALINPITQNNQPDTHGVQQTQKGQNNIQNQVSANPLLLAYLAIYEAMDIVNKSANVQSKALNLNANAQNQAISLANAMNFQTFSQSQLFREKMYITLTEKGHDAMKFSFFKSTNMKAYLSVEKEIAAGKLNANDVHIKYITRTKMSGTVLEQVQAQNQQISTDRGVLQDQLSVLQQSSQIGETDLNSSVNLSQQDVSQGYTLSQMLVTLASQIARV